MRLLASLILLALTGSAFAQTVSGTPSSWEAWVIVYSLRPDVLDPQHLTPEEVSAVDHHSAQLQALDKAGRLVLAGISEQLHPLAPEPFEIVIVTGTRKDAETIQTNDTAVKAGLMRGKLDSFRVYISHHQQAFK